MSGEDVNLPASDFASDRLSERLTAFQQSAAGPAKKRPRLNTMPAPAQDASTTKRPQASPSPLQPHHIPNQEYVRLLQQAITEVGHPAIAAQLASATGVECETEHIAALRARVLAGQWQAACECADSCPGLDLEQRKNAKFILLKECVLESICQGDSFAALDCLRQQMQPLNVREEELHQLAGCLLCESREELRHQLDWQGPNATSRQQVLAALQRCIPSHIMLPSARLSHLVLQAYEAQLASCTQYDNDPDLKISLFEDYHAGLSQLPVECTQVVTDHEDQVFVIAFSPDGSMVVSGSCNNMLCFWDVDQESQTLKPRANCKVPGCESIMSVQWSPCGKHVATQHHSDCKRTDMNSISTMVTVWSIEGHELACHSLPQVSGLENGLGWSGCGRYLLQCGHSQYLHIFDLDIDPMTNTIGQPKLLHRSRPGKTYDCSVSSDGRWLALCFSVTVSVYDLHMLIDCAHAHGDLSACKVSDYKPLDETIHVRFMQDSNRLCCDHKDRSISVLVLEEKPEWAESSRLSRILRPLQRLHPPVLLEKEPQKLRFTPTGGGKNSAFVAMGSYCGDIMLWHWPSGNLLTTLTGHDEAVNVVAWSPTDPHLLVSASDDGTVRVWTSPAFHKHSPEVSMEL